MTALKALVELQRKRVSARRWSENGAYSDYLAQVNDNFLAPLYPDLVEAYRDGAGGELPPHYDDKFRRGYRLYSGKQVPAKMQAIHSSSALVCNAFGYWYGEKDRYRLAEALGIEGEVEGLSFEDKKPTGLGRIPPHMDVCIYCGSKIYAVESKFSEPYQSEKKRVSMGSESYSSKLWSAKGLEACGGFVEKIGNGEFDGRFKYLDVPQLLKHLLGLQNNHRDHFELIYLWYDMPGFREADRHRKEIERFTSLLEGEVLFRSLTYQDLHKRLANRCAGLHRGHLKRFAERYL